MTAVEARGLTIRYGHSAVISRLDLRADTGEFLVLLGPSGCGKSTLLNAIAGLVDVDEGQIWIGNRNVTWLEPKDRGIAMVFQSYALYPTMDVYHNLAFSLKVAGLSSSEIDKRVQHAAEILGLLPFLKRRPSALSGGQRQRVAIGRALVREVGVFLFDEPLSNLDAQLRADLRVEIKQLHRRLHNTTIYVTHDQVEALTLADRIAVMHGGTIQQLGDPDSVYHRPTNRFVASFLGSPAMNFIPGEIDELADRSVVRIAELVIPLPPGHEAVAGQKGRRVIVGIRPEHIVVGRDAQAEDLCWPAEVEVRESLGSEALLWTSLGGVRASIRTPVKEGLREGETIPAGFSGQSISVFDSETGVRI